MKKITFLLMLCLMVVGCSEDSLTTAVNTNPANQVPPENENPPADVENKVLLLKVDYETNAFEGGVELVFPETDTFTISADYNAPGDFGDITLNYSEVGQPLFMGSIIWMGTGNMVYPCAMDVPEQFDLAAQNVPIPSLSQFQKVMYDEFAIYPEPIDYAAIWNAIDDLQLVATYRQSNPTAKVNVFLYTPSVGVGNPAEWDWYVILKN